MKKLLCSILCLLLLLGVLASCGLRENEPDDSGDGSNDVSESRSDDSPETEKKELVPEDFSVGGTARDLTMLARNGRTHYLWVEKDSTDKVESAAYKRNQRVQTEFGVNIRLVPESDKTANWVTALSSGNEYDLVVPDYWWMLEQQGLFINLNARDELDFDQPYWYSNWNDNITVNNKLYTAVGDASLEVLENIEIVFFNKSLIDTINVDMYDLVDSKLWTIDKMLELGASFADSANESYGAIYDRHSLDSQLFSAGLKLTEIKDSGTIELIADRAINTNIQEKVKGLIHHETTNFYGNNNARDNKGVQGFGEGKAAFYATSMYVGKAIKNTGVDYGVVPMPMYEGGEGASYISTSYGVSTFAIPKNAKDYHFSAVLLDALNYYAYDTIVTNFFDITMKAQLADGSDDARMMDIARESLYFDFAWMLDAGGMVTVFNAFRKATSNATTELSSTLDSAMSTSIGGLADIAAFYAQD